MDEKKQMVNVPYFVHEAEMARAERNIKTLTVSLVVAIVLIFLSNMLWLYAWMQYDYGAVTTEETVVKQDGEGMNNVNMGTQGDVNNGTDGYDTEDDTKGQDTP